MIRINIGKRSIPVWLLIAALVVSGAGAAVGTVLAGKVTGEVPVTVSQALLVDTPLVTSGSVSGASYKSDGAPQTIYQKNDSNLVITSEPARHIATVKDDHTAFQVAAEIGTGDAFAFALPFKNASSQDMVAQLKLVFPEGISVEAYAPTTATSIYPNLVRTGLYTWKLQIKTGADYGSTDIIKIVVAAADDLMPGFYTIEGQISQISY
jgi:hypothetical protein